MARISGALGRSCYVEVHETAEISPLPARRTNPRARARKKRIRTQKCTRACAYRALCTTHDRELAPPSAPVGQSSLLTHTRGPPRSHTRTRAHTRTGARTHERAPILYSYVHMAHRRDEKSGYVSSHTKLEFLPAISTRNRTNFPLLLSLPN